MVIFLLILTVHLKNTLYIGHKNMNSFNFEVKKKSVKLLRSDGGITVYNNGLELGSFKISSLFIIT